MDFDFEELKREIAKVQRKQRTYDWDKVVEYIRKHKFVTLREVALVAKCKYVQQAQQWLTRHTYMVVDMESRKKKIIHNDGIVVKIVYGRNVVYMHRDRLQATKPAKQ